MQTQTANQRKERGEPPVNVETGDARVHLVCARRMSFGNCFDTGKIAHYVIDDIVLMCLTFVQS